MANTVARRMVTPPHRDGGQAQFVEAAVPPAQDGGSVARAMTHVLANLAAPWTVDQFASRAGMSARTFTRRFREATGSTPIRWLAGQRVRATLPALETGLVGIEVLARRVGLDVVTYRRHFHAAMSTSPAAYRRAFGDGPTDRTRTS